MVYTYPILTAWDTTIKPFFHIKTLHNGIPAVSPIMSVQIYFPQIPYLVLKFECLALNIHPYANFPYKKHCIMVYQLHLLQYLSNLVFIFSSKPLNWDFILSFQWRDPCICQWPTLGKAISHFPHKNHCIMVDQLYLLQYQEPLAQNIHQCSNGQLVIYLCTQQTLKKPLFSTEIRTPSLEHPSMLQWPPFSHRRRSWWEAKHFLLDAATS